MRKQVWKSYCLDSEIVSSSYAAIKRMAGWLFFFVVTFPPYFLWHSVTSLLASLYYLVLWNEPIGISL